MYSNTYFIIILKWMMQEGKQLLNLMMYLPTYLLSDEWHVSAAAVSSQSVLPNNILSII